MFIVFLLLSLVISWVRCGTRLYRFLIFAVILTSIGLIALRLHMLLSTLIAHIILFGPFFSSMHLSYARSSTRETLSLGVSEQQRRRPACASVQPDQRLRHLGAS